MKGHYRVADYMTSKGVGGTGTRMASISGKHRLGNNPARGSFSLRGAYTAHIAGILVNVVSFTGASMSLLWHVFCSDLPVI